MDELLVFNGGNNPTESVQLDAALMAKHHKAIFRSTPLFIWLQMKNKGLLLVKTLDV